MAKKKTPVDKEMQQLEDTGFTDLVKQVNAEYEIAWRHQVSKIQTSLSRLKLYNNQKKDKDAVGDPLLFTVMQTLLASLYNDQLSVEFIAREEGDEETAQTLTALAQYDHRLMGLSKLKHDWIWDTLFFSHSLVKMVEFDRSKEFMCPIPELIDPMTWLRDPRAVSINGDMRNRGGMRFGGREIWMPRHVLSDEKGYINTKDIKGDSEVNSLVKQARQARDSAQDLQSLETMSDSLTGDNESVSGLEWYTWWKGKRVSVTLANGKKTIIKYKELGDNFPIIDRVMYPTAHEWDGVSLPDLIEDKQRQRSVAMNLTLQSMKADLYPMYIYDETKIKNKADLLEFQFNKFVGVKGEGDVRGAVQPINKASPRMDLVSFVLDSLDASAQRATATPEMQQGAVSDNKRTLGELNLIASKVDTRYSLSAKIFGWSEKAFWEQWYRLYKENFKSGIDEKIVRLEGPMGDEWRGYTRENIIARLDPDVEVESLEVSANKKLKERTLMMGYSNIIMQDPNANKREFAKYLAKVNGLSPNKIALFYPDTPDEILAKSENKKINNDEIVNVNPDDNDQVHMIIHNKCKDSRAKYAHMEAHKAAMLVKRSQPELFNPESKMLNPMPSEQQNVMGSMVNAAKLTPSATA